MSRSGIQDVSCRELMGVARSQGAWPVSRATAQQLLLPTPLLFNRKPGLGSLLFAVLVTGDSVEIETKSLSSRTLPSLVLGKWTGGRSHSVPFSGGHGCGLARQELHSSFSSDVLPALGLFFSRQSMSQARRRCSLWDGLRWLHQFYLPRGS